MSKYTEANNQQSVFLLCHLTDAFIQRAPYYTDSHAGATWGLSEHNDDSSQISGLLEFVPAAFWVLVQILRLHHVQIFDYFF